MWTGNSYLFSGNDICSYKYLTTSFRSAQAEICRSFSVILSVAVAVVVVIVFVVAVVTMLVSLTALGCGFRLVQL